MTGWLGGLAIVAAFWLALKLLDRTALDPAKDAVDNLADGPGGRLIAGTLLAGFAITVTCGLGFLAVVAYAALEGVAR